MKQCSQDMLGRIQRTLLVWFLDYLPLRLAAFPKHVVDGFMKLAFAISLARDATVCGVDLSICGKQ